MARNGSQPAKPGSADFFTGSVSVEILFAAKSPSHMSAAAVTFQPGARSAWHTYPVGQVLLITAGDGWIQTWGGPVQEMHAGDAVRIPPGVKHWHGASATTFVTHIALQEELDGKNVNWLEKVSDEQYSHGPEQPPFKHQPSATQRTNTMSNKEPSAARKPRRHFTQAGATHRRRALRRRVGAPGTLQARPQPRHRHGTDRGRQHRATALPPQASQGKRRHGGRNSSKPSRIWRSTAAGPKP